MLVLAALTRKRAKLGYIAAGGKIDPAGNGTEDDKRTKVTAAIAKYLADCRDRQGKSGYGPGARTVEDYEYRLSFLAEYGPDAYLDQVDVAFIRGFRSFLRKHPADFGDRSCHNIMQAVSTFLIRSNIMAAKPVLKEMSFPPTEVIPYTDADLPNHSFTPCVDADEVKDRLPRINADGANFHGTPPLFTFAPSWGL
jgi:hypothetical protein